MARHGSGYRNASRAEAARMFAGAGGTGSVDTGSPSAGHAGFGHFGGDPGPTGRWTLEGRPFHARDPVQHKRASQLLEKLAARQEREHDSDQTQPGDNPDLPSGYTYLLQLVAHDLASSSVSPAIVETGPARILNLRTEWLKLETIYGGGPDDEPNIFTARSPATLRPETPSAGAPWLRLGRMRAAGVAAARCPFLDIPRATNTDAGAASFPLVHDARTDHHPIIAQMVVLFAHLHNSIVDGLVDGGGVTAANDEDRAHRLFETARAATTLIYRRIIRNDLLARLLHPQVHAAYEGGLDPLHGAPADGSPLRLPVEFTHAALRTGHALIRFNYKFAVATPKRTREVLLTNSSLGPDRVPVERHWIVDWRDFFDLDGAPPAANRALRLRPRNHPALQNMPGETPRIAAALAHSGWLGFRDNLSCIEGEPWALSPLRRFIAQSPSHRAFLEASPLLQTDGAWIAPVLNWINAQPAEDDEDGLTATEANWLAQDPPLPLFFLLEAKLQTPDAEGGRLGSLGSIIVADVIYRAMRAHPVVSGEMLLDLAAQLQALAATAGLAAPPNAAALARIDTMPALLRHLRPLLPEPV